MKNSIVYRTFGAALTAAGSILGYLAIKDAAQNLDLAAFYSPAVALLTYFAAEGTNMLIRGTVPDLHLQVQRPFVKDQGKIESINAELAKYKRIKNSPLELDF